MDGWLARFPDRLLGDDGEPLPQDGGLPAPGKRTLTQRLGARSEERDDSDGVGYLTRSIQMEAAPRGTVAADDPFAIHTTAREGVRDGGAALPYLAAIQASFGHHDVGGVRAHVGGAAAEASAAIGAHAYATGDDVAFAGAPDLRQAAHEAAHVVQQRGGVRLDDGVGRSGDPYEQHADAVADLVVRGDSAEALLDTMAHRGAAGGAAVQRLTHAERLAARTAASTDLSLEQLAHRMAYLDSVDALSADDRAALTAQGFDVAGIRAHAGRSSGAGDLQYWTFPAARDATVRVTPVIAFRGTESLADLSEDATAAGVGMAQFTMNQAAIQAAIHEIGDGRGVVATGHSLGGALAQIAACFFPELVVRVVTFQAPGISADVLERLRRREAEGVEGPTATHHRVDGCVVDDAGDGFVAGNVAVWGDGTNPIHAHTTFPLLAGARAPEPWMTTPDPNPVVAASGPSVDPAIGHVSAVGSTDGASDGGPARMTATGDTAEAVRSHTTIDGMVAGGVAAGPLGAIVGGVAADRVGADAARRDAYVRVWMTDILPHAEAVDRTLLDDVIRRRCGEEDIADQVPQMLGNYRALFPELVACDAVLRSMVGGDGPDGRAAFVEAVAAHVSLDARLQDRVKRYWTLLEHSDATRDLHSMAGSRSDETEASLRASERLDRARALDRLAHPHADEPPVAHAEPEPRGAAAATMSRGSRHRHPVSPDGGTSEAVDVVHSAAAHGVGGAGAALPHFDAIQASFGHHDLGGVRAHVGGAAAEAAATIGARAYATGDDVAFAASPDLRQAAHEAAHVVQQRGGVRLDGGVGRVGDPYEQHADAVADLVIRGDSAEALLDTMAHRGPAGGPAVQRDSEGATQIRALIVAAATEAAIGAIHESLISGERHGRGAAVRLTITIPAAGAVAARSFEIEPGELAELRDAAAERRGVIGRDAVRAAASAATDPARRGALLSALGRARRGGPRGNTRLHVVGLPAGATVLVLAADLPTLEQEILASTSTADPHPAAEYEASPLYADSTGATVDATALGSVDAARASVSLTETRTEEVEYVNPAVLRLFPVQSGGGIRRELFGDLTSLLSRQAAVVHDLTVARGARRLTADTATEAGDDLGDLAALRTEIAEERTSTHQRVVAELRRLNEVQTAAEGGSSAVLTSAADRRGAAVRAANRAILIRFLLLTVDLYRRNRGHAGEVAAATSELDELRVTAAERAAADLQPDESSRVRERTWRGLRGELAEYWSSVSHTRDADEDHDEDVEELHITARELAIASAGPITVTVETHAYRAVFDDGAATTLTPDIPRYNTDRPGGYIGGGAALPEETARRVAERALGHPHPAPGRADGGAGSDASDGAADTGAERAEFGADMLAVWGELEGDVNSINTWDRANISLGSGLAAVGPLQGALAALRDDYPEVFETQVRRYGIDMVGEGSHAVFTVVVPSPAPGQPRPPRAPRPGTILRDNQAEEYIADDPVLCAVLRHLADRPEWAECLAAQTIAHSAAPAVDFRLDVSDAAHVRWDAVMDGVDETLAMGSQAVIADRFHSGAVASSALRRTVSARYLQLCTEHAVDPTAPNAEGHRLPLAARQELARLALQAEPPRRRGAIAERFGTGLFEGVPAPASGGGRGRRVAPDRGQIAALPEADVHDLADAGVAGNAATLPHGDTIQRAFGHHDVSAVRAHVGGEAAAAAAAIGAQAYATGDDVAFAAAPDLRQAAHEAAHVVQQRGSVRLDGGVGVAGDAYEQHADAVADRVVRGESAEALLDTMAHRGATGGPAVQRLVDARAAAAVAVVQRLLSDARPRESVAIGHAIVLALDAMRGPVAEVDVSFVHRGETYHLHLPVSDARTLCGEVLTAVETPADAPADAPPAPAPAPAPVAPGAHTATARGDDRPIVEYEVSHGREREITLPSAPTPFGPIGAEGKLSFAVDVGPPASEGHGHHPPPGRISIEGASSTSPTGAPEESITIEGEGVLRRLIDRDLMGIADHFEISHDHDGLHFGAGIVLPEGELGPLHWQFGIDVLHYDPGEPSHPAMSLMSPSATMSLELEPRILSMIGLDVSAHATLEIELRWYPDWVAVWRAISAEFAPYFAGLAGEGAVVGGAAVEGVAGIGAVGTGTAVAVGAGAALAGLVFVGGVMWAMADAAEEGRREGLATWYIHEYAVQFGDVLFGTHLDHVHGADRVPGASESAAHGRADARDAASRLSPELRASLRRQSRTTVVRAVADLLAEQMDVPYNSSVLR